MDDKQLKQEEQSLLIKQKLLEHIERLEKLDDQQKQDGDFMDILENLNALLISANNRDVQQIASQLNLSRLFHRFNTLPADMFCDELIRVFGMFLEALPLNEIFLKYNPNILEGLSSSNLSIAELWIKKVVKPLFTNEGLLKNISTSSISVVPILKSVIKLLLRESTSLSSAAHDICVVSSKTFRQDFFSPEILDELNRLKRHEFESRKDRDQFMIRFYELCVDIACINQLMLDMMKANGFLNELIEDSKDKLENDPLVAVNVIKLFTDLASKPHGLEYLKDSTTILPFIAKKIETIDDDDPFGSLVLPGYINFIIKIAAESNVQILNEYPNVLQRLMQYCQKGKSGNRELQLLAIESIAYLCHSSDGKTFLSDKMNVFLETISMLIDSGNNDLKSRSIAALCEIMEIRGADPGNQASGYTEQWFTYLTGLNCGLDRFMTLVREPFLDVRIPALNFIRVLATTVWGQKLLANQSGFLEYLLDQRTENSKEGLDAKYDIVRELAMSPFIRLSFTPEQHLQIRGYFKQGNRSKDQVNVAMENS